jgi:hypothetical protein
VAAQVLVKMGTDLNRVRQQVIELLPRHGGEGPPSGRRLHAILREHGIESGDEAASG